MTRSLESVCAEYIYPVKLIELSNSSENGSYQFQNCFKARYDRDIAVFLIYIEKIMFSLFFIKIQRYGTHPSSEQLQDAGPMCPICHDGYRKPIFLSCKHIFCEDCLSMWLDRERTCPMCRSTVAEDPKWKDGSTSYLVQLF